jgi:hypothetical protein
MGRIRNGGFSARHSSANSYLRPQIFDEFVSVAPGLAAASYDAVSPDLVDYSTAQRAAG